MGFNDRLRLISTPAFDRPSLGKQIKTARLNADVEQGDLAEAIGVARQTLGQWEADRALPPRGMVIAIALLTGAAFEPMDEALTEAWRRRNPNGRTRRSRRVIASGGSPAWIEEDADEGDPSTRWLTGSRQLLPPNVVPLRPSPSGVPA